MRLRQHTAVTAALVLAVTLAASAARAEFAFRPDQAAAKLTAASKRLKAPFPFKHKLCITTDDTSCAFLAGSIVGAAIGPQNGKTERVHLVYSPGDGQPTDMPITWGILMALVSPEMGQNDRGKLAYQFLQAAIEPGFTSLTEERGAVTYTLSRERELGLMFTAVSEAP